MKSEPTLEDFKPFTVAWVIQRVMEDIAANPDMKQLGPTHRISLRGLQRMPIGKKDARKLSRTDFIEHCKWRRQTVKPQTINQDVTFLSGIFGYAGSTWDDCEAVTVVPILAAKPYLRKHRLIAKAEARTRRPTDEELHQLLDLFAKQNGHHRTEIDMVQVTAFALASARRISEICRITWGDIDFENKVYWVRDLKHPTRKKGNDKQFILWPALEEIIKRQPRLTTDPSERIFPYNDKSAGQRYTEAKKRIGINDLRFHDNRGDAISKYLLKMSPEDVRITVSGHDNTKILEDVYDRRDSLDIMRAKFSSMLEKTEQQGSPT